MSVLQTVATKQCVVCGKTGLMVVNVEGYRAWKGGALIQDAFPTYTREACEMLMTGIHPDCWEILAEADWE